LHVLPFAALLRNKNQYLAEWKPLHVALSATVYAELKKRRQEDSGSASGLVAFGDPQYPVSNRKSLPGSANPEMFSAVEHGFALTPLPFSKEEVNAIARFFPQHNQVFLEDQATEEKAKAVGKGVKYLHFAAHGVFDELLPLNSALALTIPENPTEGQENGLLEAWEIFEQVRIDANLVTLSACDTGLGKEVGGEGLIGLTRAFQYAGAHSVLASLWSIPDSSTAEFMRHFYQYLTAGKSKDEALREAQVDFIHLPQFHRPFYWAAFSLNGDWQ